MDKPTLSSVIDTYNSSMGGLNPDKNCNTCRYEACDSKSFPCNECCNQLLWFCVDPTKWEPKPLGGGMI